VFKRVLVAIDGSPTANRGLKVAIDLAKHHAARLYVLHVIDERAIGIGLSASGYVAPKFVEQMIEGLRQVGRKVLADAQRAAAKAGQPVEGLLIESLGEPVARIVLAQARKVKADVIVLGTHGRRGVARVVMGSDAETIVREADIPVLLVRAKGRVAR
jgi:nucleotide-binding universal stress UspA family protein